MNINVFLPKYVQYDMIIYIIIDSIAKIHDFFSHMSNNTFLGFLPPPFSPFSPRY